MSGYSPRSPRSAPLMEPGPLPNIRNGLSRVLLNVPGLGATFPSFGSNMLQPLAISSIPKYDQEHFRRRGKVFHGSQDSREHETTVRMKENVMDQYTWNFTESVPQHLAQELNTCV
ncbi:hypothetical protein CJF32_00007756 [Rutstroemia sp. NJR-2017a WRK4]|nr:hypothetical protein CJF32_00007756 [Rutstroemia sp. NJR-2017a WRK4]